MSRRKTSQIDDILSLPNTKLIDGKPYVRIVYRDAAGRQRDKTRRVDSVAEAISVIESIRQEIGERGPSAFDGERMTFAELLKEYQKAKNIPKWYSDPLLSHFGQRRIKTITYGDLQQFKTARMETPNRLTGKPRSAATINREMEWLSAILLYAVRHDWLTRNPFSKGPVPLIRKSEEKSRSRIPSPEEEANILAQCIGPRSHLRAILIAARDTGLRKGALMALTWLNVDFVDSSIGKFLSIPEGNKYKKRPKKIGITERLKVELAILWEESKKERAAPVFGGITEIKRSYNTACRKAGVTDLHFHDWRHGFATDMMEAGIEERLAMRAAGHTNPDTHAIYTNVDERLALMIAERLNILHQTRRGNEVESKVTAIEYIN